MKKKKDPAKIILPELAGKISPMPVKRATEKKSQDSNSARVVRRRVVRMANHLTTSVNYAFAARKDARKLDKLDDVQFLTEIIAMCKQALGYLNYISRHHFMMPLDQLVKKYK